MTPNADYGMVPCEGTGWWADFGICRMCGEHVETENSMAVRHKRLDIERYLDTLPPNDGKGSP